MADADLLQDLPDDRDARYQAVYELLQAILDGESVRIARLSTVVGVLTQAFAPRFFWCGVYLADPTGRPELVIGPYQGTLGCLRIPFGRGVCGAAAQRQEAVLVPDVHAFPGHIACDARSRSEVVLPMVGRDGELVGVLDVDSAEPAAFDARDLAGLERILALALAE